MDCPRLTRPWSCSGLQCILFFLTSFMETPFTHTTFAFSLFQELLNIVITFVKFLRLMNVLEFCLFWTKSIVKKVIIFFVTRKSILILYIYVSWIPHNRYCHSAQGREHNKYERKRVPGLLHFNSLINNCARLPSHVLRTHKFTLIVFL